MQSGEVWNMKKKWFPAKEFICIWIWLLLAVQPARGNSGCDVAVSFHSPESDTMRLPDRWLARDKLEHVAVSAFLSGVSYSIFRDFYCNKQETSAYFSATLTFGLGLGKEFCDRRAPRGKFSYKDLVADILGMGLGLLIATR
jgi:uncharacterized protein YfiM (DUF2279 family)